MATHATMPARGRRARARTPARHRHTPLAWAVPVTLGVILGFWAFFIRRDGGTTTDGQIWLGVVSGAGFAALCFALGRMQRALPRELRAAAYGALSGAAIGYLYSLHDNSVLASTVLGLVVAAGMLCMAYYVFHTREE
ncbi:hypothetical protein [Streptomyces sp. B1I3]|uniref:hypothetical protein n=1 Tax=Streptomyces sp. B1I3 TaxID=3042264 RepID=UPI00278A5F04|nr:hypothetical protein [Streptomyces sp. B1I3]MDQ0795346.1 hypothetical protein [Streptomyces sp. B1I3]